MSDRLTGPDLLKALKDLGPATKAEMLRATGYVAPPKKEGAPERLLRTQFHEALLEAKGVVLDVVKPEPAGRTLGHICRQQKAGTIVVGAAYVEQLGFEAGQTFSIEIEKEAGAIRLVACEDPGEGEDDGEGEED